MKNKERYWEYIRNLRNDPLVKTGFINQHHITIKEQIEYMIDNNDSYYICLLKGLPVGYIGDIMQDIRLAVSPDCQRRGVGYFMLREFMKLHPGAYAKVLRDNEPSKKLFLAAGFKQAHPTDEFYFFVNR